MSAVLNIERVYISSQCNETLFILKTLMSIGPSGKCKSNRPKISLCESPQDAGELEEAGLHHGVDAVAHAHLAGDRTGPSRGNLIVLSAPSGTGKTTVCRQALERDGGLVFSISHTTRAPRSGESDGVHYHFYSVDDYQRLVASEGLLEASLVHDHWYGTPRDQVQSAIRSGRDAILKIDVQGADKVRARIPQALLIFVVPPSIDELERRLEGVRLTGEVSPRLRARLMSTGELASTQLGAATLVRHGLSAGWVDARDLLTSRRRDREAEAEHLIETLEATAGDYAARVDARVTGQPAND